MSSPSDHALRTVEEQLGERIVAVRAYRPDGGLFLEIPRDQLLAVDLLRGSVAYVEDTAKGHHCRLVGTFALALITSPSRIVTPQ